MEEPQLISYSPEPYRLLVRLAALEKLELRLDSLKGSHRSVADPSTAPRDLSEERRQAKLYCHWMQLDFEKSFAADVMAELARITKLAHLKPMPGLPAPRTTAAATRAASPVAVARSFAPVHSYTPAPVPQKAKSSIWFWLAWLAAALIVTMWVADDWEPWRAGSLLASIMLIPAAFKTYSWFEKRRMRKSNNFPYRDYPPRY